VLVVGVKVGSLVGLSVLGAAVGLLVVGSSVGAVGRRKKKIAVSFHPQSVAVGEKI
jgi:hypothetical protein